MSLLKTYSCLVAVKRDKPITVKKEPIEKLVIKKETLEKYTKPETVNLKAIIKKEAVEPKKSSSPQLATVNPTTSGASFLPDRAQIDTLLALLNKSGTQMSSAIGKKYQPKKSRVISNTTKPVLNPPSPSPGQSVITSTEKKRTATVSPKVASPSQKKLPTSPSLITPPKSKVVHKQTGQLSTAIKTPTPAGTTSVQPSQVTRVTSNPSATLLSSTTNHNTYFLVTSGGTTSPLVLLPQAAPQMQQHISIGQQSSAPSLSNTVIVTTPQTKVHGTLQKSLQGSHSITSQVKTSKLQLKTKAAAKSTAVASSAAISSPLMTPSSSSLSTEMNRITPAIHLPRTSLPDLIPSVPKSVSGSSPRESLPSKQPPSVQIPVNTSPITSTYSVLQQPGSAMTKPLSSPLEKPTLQSPSATRSPNIAPPLKTQSPVSFTSIVNTGSSSCHGSATHTLASLSLTGNSPGLTKLSTASSPISGHTQSRELLSPLKSPVEQIFEEHSYLGSQDIFSLPASSTNRQGPATGSSSLMDTGSEVAEKPEV